MDYLRFTVIIGLKFRSMSCTSRTLINMLSEIASPNNSSSHVMMGSPGFQGLPQKDGAVLGRKLTSPYRNIKITTNC